MSNRSKNPKVRVNLSIDAETWRKVKNKVDNASAHTEKLWKKHILNQEE